MENIEQRVRKIVAEQLGVNEAEVKNESSFLDDLGADSLDMVELVMCLEDEFETEVAGARVTDRTVIADRKEPIAIDSQIKGVLGVVDVPLIEQLRNVSQQHTTALRVRARPQHRGRINVGELSPRLLEADGARVGNIVAGDIEVTGCSPKAAQTDIE